MRQVSRNAKADRISTKFIHGGNRAMAPYDTFCRRSMRNNNIDASPLQLLVCAGAVADEE
jgi:hypothetical protein